jgi:hypothetical protein
MKKSSKIKDIDQNMIEEEMARIIPGKIEQSCFIKMKQEYFDSSREKKRNLL